MSRGATNSHETEEAHPRSSSLSRSKTARGHRPSRSSAPSLDRPPSSLAPPSPRETVAEAPKHQEKYRTPGKSDEEAVEIDGSGSSPTTEEKTHTGRSTSVAPRCRGDSALLPFDVIGESTAINAKFANNPLLIGKFKDKFKGKGRGKAAVVAEEQHQSDGVPAPVVAGKKEGQFSLAYLLLGVDEQKPTAEGVLEEMKNYPAQVFFIDGRNVTSVLLTEVFDGLVNAGSDGGPSYSTHFMSEHSIYGYRKEQIERSVDMLICSVKGTVIVTGLNVQFTRDVCGQNNWSIAFTDKGTDNCTDDAVAEVLDFIVLNQVRVILVHRRVYDGRRHSEIPSRLSEIRCECPRRITSVPGTWAYSSPGGRVERRPCPGVRLGNYDGVAPMEDARSPSEVRCSL